MKTKGVISAPSSYFLLCVVILFAVSCTKKNVDFPNSCMDSYINIIHTEIERPENIKPIDWKNYNDVYTVYWTYHERCCCQKWVFDDLEKYIKISGWLYRGKKEEVLDGLSWPGWFYLIDNYDESNTFAENLGTVGPFVTFMVKERHLVEALREKFATSDITSKWHIRGKTQAIQNGLHGADFAFCTFHSIETSLIKRIRTIFEGAEIGESFSSEMYIRAHHKK